MRHRLAVLSDLDRIMEIVSDARAFLRKNGINQWQDRYPEREIFIQDIEKGGCYVFTDEDRIVGMISLVFSPEPSYLVVFGGNWLSKDKPYAVFHRSAVSSDSRGRGIAGEMMSYVEKKAKEKGLYSMRVDTHRDNKAMRRLLEKNAYIHCGSIHLDGPGCDVERVCYEKILEDS